MSSTRMMDTDRDMHDCAEEDGEYYTWIYLVGHNTPVYSPTDNNWSQFTINHSITPPPSKKQRTSYGMYKEPCSSNFKDQPNCATTNTVPHCSVVQHSELQRTSQRASVKKCKEYADCSSHKPVKRHCKDTDYLPPKPTVDRQCSNQVECNVQKPPMKKSKICRNKVLKRKSTTKRSRKVGDGISFHAFVPTNVKVKPITKKEPRKKQRKRNHQNFPIYKIFLELLSQGNWDESGVAWAKVCLVNQLWTDAIAINSKKFAACYPGTSVFLHIKKSIDKFFKMVHLNNGSQFRRNATRVEYPKVGDQDFWDYLFYPTPGYFLNFRPGTAPTDLVCTQLTPTQTSPRMYSPS